MAYTFALSLASFSLIWTSLAFADSDPLNQEPKTAQINPTHQARKKPKAHFAGTKRPQQNHTNRSSPQETRRKSSHVKNQWVVSKTHPKADKKQIAYEEPPIQKAALSLPPPSRLMMAEAKTPALTNPILIEQIQGLDRKVGRLQSEIDQLKMENDRDYPRTGIYATQGSVYFTGEWIFWRTREGGTEFAVERSSSSPGVLTDAVPKKVTFDWESGFRLGFGVHLPHDGWDININYTLFQPSGSDHTSGSVFPLLAFQGQFPVANVSDANAHASIDFQTLDVSIGRAYYLAKSLGLRPFIGAKGAWIDQHFHIHYTGGDIPAGQEYRIEDHNDFKGGGLLFGIESYWELGSHFSLFGNLSGALLIGHFDLKQNQVQLNGVKTIDLDSDFNLLSPTVDLILGFSWDRNFANDRCHFGLSAGFESQYWWRQNQMEHFTDSSFPIYIRSQEDLACYGLTLKARLDF